MKAKLILRTVGLLILMASLFEFSSCSKSADRNLTKEQKDERGKNPETSLIDEKDFTESDEDLTTVDYKEFYEQLSPYGEWIQLNPEEIGLQKTASSGTSDKNGITLSNLLGIKDAHSESVASAGMVFVWKPSTDLAVVRVEGESPVYVPYSNGQWVNTEAGWYFKSPTPQEEIVHHFGRWVNSLTDGWLWVPGRVWSPAWVDWKQNESYVSWSPLPPSVYIVNNNVIAPPIAEDRYIIVEKKYFVQPQIYKYMYKENNNKIMIKEMTKTDGVMIVNKTIINKGPGVADIEKYFGNKIEIVKISKVNVKSDVKYSDNEYYVLSPVFSKVKYSDKVTTPVFQPKSFVKKSELKERRSDEKGSNKEGEIRKGNNGNDNGKKNDGNDNGKKNDGNDNGKKNDGNDNGKKKDGNDNGKKKDGNDNKDKGNGKEKGKK